MRVERNMLVLLLLLCCSGSLFAQPFTYQGMLKQNGVPVNATLSMTFKLYDALTGGNPVGSSITQNVSVQNGLFTVQLDFGAVWTGQDRYLEITVGSNTLSPRVKITPTPYAAFAQLPWQKVGSNIFYTDGYVGIGTNSPSVRLSLGGDNANTKIAIWDGGGSGVMGFGVGPGQFRLHLHNPANRFSFLDAQNGNEIMTVLGNGNVGIGTSNPSERLHVNGNIRLADDRSIFGLDSLVGYNDLRLYGDATGGPDLFIAANGNVGIGTVNPQARLHVNGAAFFTQGTTTLQVLPNRLFDQTASDAATLEIPGDGVIGIWDSLSVLGNLHVGGNRFTLGGGTDPTWSRVGAFVENVGGSDFVGNVVTYGPNGNSNTRLGWAHVDGTPYPNHGWMGVHDANGTPKARMYVSGTGHGVIIADVKFFCVPDPEDATRDIYYGCIEGPELAMYVRGTARLVNGRAHIELPDHFRKLADEQGMTVQLTPRSAESKGLAAVRVSLNGIEVVELLNGRGNYEFDWRVEAVRKEHRDFRVYHSWDEVMPAGTNPAEAWAARLKSLQDRQARQSEKQ
ncbi:MAG: hypothetical protein KatS3mg022_2260 [Armatimonadota bacterium]|nr:MAG: hypothetical protein KatS3mg022_2260 [Armatimonadota bacterium]